MKPNQFATLTLRLLGIFCLLQVLPMLPIFFSMFFFMQSDTGGPGIMMLIAGGLALAFWLGGGVLLIVRSVQWGEKLTPSDIPDQEVTKISFEQVQMIAFAAVGALIVAESLPELFTAVFYIVNFLTVSDTRDVSRSLYANRQMVTVFGTLAKLTLGLWMFLGARGFVNFWRSLRTVGTPKPTQT